MEYVSGGELFQLIKKYKRLTEDMVVFYLAEVINHLLIFFIKINYNLIY
jgi:hypothetical protein